MNKAIFFDRDGVINDVIFRKNKPSAPRSFSEFIVDKEKINIINELSKTYLIFVVSNQPDVQRGKMKIEELTKMNHFLNENIILKEIVNEIKDDNKFKKPSPYMIDMLCKKYSINKNKSFIVGDRWVDILSGKRAGVKTVLLEKDYSNLKTSIGAPPDDLIPNFKIKHLNELKKII